jgi:hypothetical protein
MWIYVNGALTNIDQCRYIVPTRDHRIAVSDTTTITGFATNEECVAEIRRIALAIAYGADVYEIGEGILQYEYSSDTIGVGQYIGVDLEAKSDDEDDSAETGL